MDTSAVRLISDIKEKESSESISRESLEADGSIDSSDLERDSL